MKSIDNELSTLSSMIVAYSEMYSRYMFDMKNTEEPMPDRVAMDMRLMESFVGMITSKFPNGFTSWQRTHFEITEYVTRCRKRDTVIRDLLDSGGELFEVAEEWTDRFESDHIGEDWTQKDFYQAIFLYCQRLNKKGE